jgi:2-polyprenyl-6-methoxyphenol hydroxylase-like FAD-dependent oxidoreductase
MTTPLTVKCCIAGGGPAGMMLGFLLARAGLDVIVLEKHGDFLRDFRGDTIHPSTLQLMHELGLLDEFMRLPHREVPRLSGEVGDTKIALADFSRVPTLCKFIVLMPQWDFLNFLAEKGRRYPGFKLLMQTETNDLIEGGGRVVGVRATGENGPLDIRADLAVAADGRHSTLRARAGFVAQDLGAPMDVLWMRLSRQSDDSAETFGHIEAGRIFIMLDRGDYWQCAFVIPKGSANALRQRDIGDFRRMVLEMSPWLGQRVEEIRSWDDVSLLTVAVDRLTRWWRPGLLCIGDAAHAMSPIGGVGINLAVQDAVAAANILAEPLRSGTLRDEHLMRVQKRREWPAQITQRIQLFVQNRVVSPVLAGTERPQAPWLLKLFGSLPVLQGIPARLVGVGVRPEHIRTPEVSAPA